MAIKVIVVGAGARGRDWVREVRRAAEYELAACVETDEESLRQTASAFGLSAAQCFRSLEEALRAVDCDAVIVATPADRHTESCETAISQGLAALVEKPFTTNLSDAVRLVRLAGQRKVPLVVGQNYRYMRSFRTVRRLVAEGALGQVGIAVCQYYRVPHEMVASLAGMTNSILWGMGIHHLDALRYVLDRKVTGVMSDSFTLPWGRLPQGASMRVMLHFEDGARALYSATYESSGHEFFERGQEFYLRLVGERATLHVFHRWLVLCERGRWPRLVGRGSRAVTEEQILLRQLAGAIRDGSAPESSGRDNLQTMAVAEAFIRSVNEKRWVDPQELLNEEQEEKARAGHRA
jgi:predicted dehydrogenase